MKYLLAGVIVVLWFFGFWVLAQSGNNRVMIGLSGGILLLIFALCAVLYQL